MGAGASTPRIQQLQQQLLRNAILSKEEDEAILTDPVVIAKLSAQVRECLMHARLLKDELIKGSDPNSPQVKERLEAFRNVLRPPPPPKRVDSRASSRATSANYLRSASRARVRSDIENANNTPKMFSSANQFAVPASEFAVPPAVKANPSRCLSARTPVPNVSGGNRINASRPISARSPKNSDLKLNTAKHGSFTFARNQRPPIARPTALEKGENDKPSSAPSGRTREVTNDLKAKDIPSQIVALTSLQPALSDDKASVVQSTTPNETHSSSTNTQQPILIEETRSNNTEDTARFNAAADATDATSKVNEISHPNHSDAVATVAAEQKISEAETEMADQVQNNKIKQEESIKGEITSIEMKLVSKTEPVISASEAGSEIQADVPIADVPIAELPAITAVTDTVQQNTHFTELDGIEHNVQAQKTRPTSAARSEKSNGEKIEFQPEPIQKSPDSTQQTTEQEAEIRQDAEVNDQRDSLESKKLQGISSDSGQNVFNEAAAGESVSSTAQLDHEHQGKNESIQATSDGEACPTQKDPQQITWEQTQEDVGSDSKESAPSEVTKEQRENSNQINEEEANCIITKDLIAVDYQLKKSQELDHMRVWGEKCGDEADESSLAQESPGGKNTSTSVTVSDDAAAVQPLDSGQPTPQTLSKEVDSSSAAGVLDSRNGRENDLALPDKTVNHKKESDEPPIWTPNQTLKNIEASQIDTRRSIDVQSKTEEDFVDSAALRDVVTQLGVSFYFLKKFLETHQDRIADSSTKDVFVNIIQPLIVEQQISYVEYLQFSGNGQHVSSATVFVSHAWSAEFKDLVFALEKWISDCDVPEADCYLWIDIFSFNHFLGINDFGAWTTEFKAVLESTGDALIVLSPGAKPVWCGRIWCLYEMFVLSCTAVQTEFVLSPQATDQLLTSLAEGVSFFRLISKIDISCAESWDKETELRIKNQIERTVGASVINETIIRQMREWMIPLAKEALLKIEPSKRLTSELHYALADLLPDLGMHEEALAMQHERLEFKLNQGTEENSAEVIDTKECMGLLSHDLGQYDEALDLFYEVLAMKVEQCPFGEVNKSLGVAATLKNIGAVLDSQGKYSESLGKYEEALETLRAVYGSKHIQVADTLSNLGFVHDKLGRHYDALRVYEEAYDIYCPLLGNRNLRVAEALSNVASIYEQLGRFKEALAKHQEALDIKFETVGPTDVTVADTENNIGSVLLRMNGRGNEAITHLENALQIYVNNFGMGDLSVATALMNIGAAYRDQGNSPQALSNYQEALNIQVAVLGEKHEDVALTKEHMAYLWVKAGNMEESRKCYREAHAVYSAVLGPKHPSTQRVANALKAA